MIALPYESRSAEDVLPGHPDRLCDAIAEAIVSRAQAIDPEAVVSVEVSAFRRSVHLTGDVWVQRPTGTPRADDRARYSWLPEELEPLVREQLEGAGAKDRWAHEFELSTTLYAGMLTDEDRPARPYSTDQTISVGHADPEGPDLLPVEVATARRVRRALDAARTERADALGPDGKVLVELAVPVPGPGRSRRSRPRLERIGVSIQHAEGVGYPELHRWLLPHLEAALDGLAPHVDPGIALEPDRLRINGSGAFVRGGLAGDGGLSGKKLVVDHYGPRIPIGGGAICGKDVHHPDRVGALRARQLAVRLARASGQAATVTLGYLPGLATPDRLGARLADGTYLDAEGLAARIDVPDLSLVGSVAELRIWSVYWPYVMRQGYFGSGFSWEE